MNSQIEVSLPDVFQWLEFSIRQMRSTLNYYRWSGLPYDVDLRLSDSVSALDALYRSLENYCDTEDVRESEFDSES